jgi:ribose/xylose/arabinose/galactoside ABC-type transport system permease subunit
MAQSGPTTPLRKTSEGSPTSVAEEQLPAISRSWWSRLYGARGRRMPDSVVVTIPLLIAIIGLGAYTASQEEVFLTWDNLQAILVQVAALGVLSVGMTLLMVAGQLDLSVGAAATFIGVLAAKLVTGGASELVTVIVCLAVGAGVGLLIGAIVASTRVAPFILTLGGLSVFSSLALIVADGQPIPTGEAFTGFALDKLLGFNLPVVLMLVLFVAGALVLRYTRLGRNAYATGSNEEAAFLAGVPTSRVKVWLFGLNGLLVGAAGIVLLARLGAGDPRSGEGLELQAIAAVVLGGATLSGGRGTMWGTFLGVLLLGEIQNSLNLLDVQAFYQNLVLGGILIVAVVIAAITERRRAGGRGWRTLLVRPGPTGEPTTARTSTPDDV